MSLTKLIINVVKVKSTSLIALVVNTLFIVSFYYLLFENSEIFYPLILSICIILVYFVIEVIKYRGFLKKLDDSRRSPDYNNKNDSYFESQILDIIGEIHHDYLKKIYTLNQTISNKDALLSQWIHNMKTSITVIGLACEKSASNEDSTKYINDIKEENNILKKNLEECLNVLRLEDFSRDYITAPCNLKKLINDLVNSQKRNFIYKEVFPKVDINENIYVQTDEKWCGYMLEQILSNAIKYSDHKNGSIIEISAVETNDTIELSIKDSGLGIATEDLPRVFEPFFTGSNGRKQRSATGIGLYMVKLISNKLGHDVDIHSEFSVGTVFKVLFRNKG